MTAVVFAYALTAAARLILLSAPAAEPEPRACLPAKATEGLGVVDPFHVPIAAATQLNAEGKVSYRLGQWDDARKKYRAAEAADPQFLAPALNVACSFVRQERFGEAMSEVLRLLDRAYLPWSEEVLSAADLGALKIRPEGKQLGAALQAARFRWAQGLVNDLIFVARTRAPLKLGDPKTAAGPFVLGPRQEVFAWSPRTRRYRQLTSKEGRVLAATRSLDGRRLAYVTAEKWVPGPEGEVALRGVAVEEQELGTLTTLGRWQLDGDVARVEILDAGASFAYRIDRLSASNGQHAVTTHRLKDGEFPVTPVRRTLRPVVTLTGLGVAAVPSGVPLPAVCPGVARDVRASGAPPIIEVASSGGRAPKGTPLTIGGPFGAGLTGLPIP